jgi:MFS family permease
VTPSLRSPGAVLTLASAAQAAVSLVTFGLPAIGPELREEFGLSLPELGAVIAAGLLGSGVALVVAGIAVDRLGGRRAMLAGTALACAGLVAAALAPGTTALFVALFVFGLGSAVVPVAGTGALFRVYPTARLGRALGVRQTAVPLGGTVAAVAYPSLQAAGGTELALLVSAVAVGVAGVTFALATGDDRLPSSARITRPFRTILRAPGLRRLLAVAACYIVVLQALLTFVVPSIRAAGHSDLTASVAYFGINLAAMAARIAWGSIADRQGGDRRVRTLVEVGLVAAGGALGFVLARHGAAPLVVAAAVVFGLGALGWNALVYLSAGERVDPELAGRSVAVAATVVFVLSGIVTPLLGALADAAGWDAFWLATAATAGLGAVLAARLPAFRAAAAVVPPR